MCTKSYIQASCDAEEKTTPFSVSFMTSQVLYRAAQDHVMHTIDPVVRRLGAAF